MRTTQLIDGRPVVSSELKPFPHLQVIAAMKAATLMCLWILFEPVRNQSNIIVAAIPTRGDLTVTDDALLLHDIIKCAWQQGHPVCYYGADNASPHASLCRGIQRGLVLQEINSSQNGFPTEMPTQNQQDARQRSSLNAPMKGKSYLMPLRV